MTMQAQEVNGGERRRCRLLTCGRRFKPTHEHHYFCHEFCWQKALTLYAGSDLPLRSDGSVLLSRDLKAGRWNPLYEEAVPGKRHTMRHRLTLTPVTVDDPNYWFTR